MIERQVSSHLRPAVRLIPCLTASHQIDNVTTDQSTSIINMFYWYIMYMHEQEYFTVSVLTAFY